VEKVDDILIGTSGYDHPELKGSFYPLDLPRKDFLEFYSTRFNALEINSTFYGMPDARRMLSFFERSKGRLCFSVKLTRVLTHEISGSWETLACEFKAAVAPLLENNVLSSVLIQFPESFGYFKENRFYLARLLESLYPLPCVVEFRRRDWIRESVFEGLEKRNAGIVFCDMPPLRNLPDGFSSGTPFIGPNAYIRLHGRNANGWYAGSGNGSGAGNGVLGAGETHRYDYEYSSDELESFIPVINGAVLEGRKVQLYFNNHPKGTGFSNALQLKKMIFGEEPQIQREKGLFDF